MSDKTIVRTRIFKFHAEEKVMCAPPAILEAEAAIDVTFSDGTSEVQYISDVTLDECCLMIAKKPLAEFSEDEDNTAYIIASFESEEDALATPYADSIKLFLNLFKQLAEN